MSAGSIGGEKTPREDSTLSPQRETGCFFPSDPWKENCLMMPSELPPRSRTGEGHGMVLQVPQFEASAIFSQPQRGLGELRKYFLDKI